MTLRDALLFLGLASAAGCAQIDGKTDELDQSAGGARGKDAGSADSGAADAGQETDDAAESPDAGAGLDASLVAPGLDAGMSTPDAGDPDTAKTPDAGTVAKPADGTCATPFELTFSSNRVTVSGNTTGAAETLSPKCLPSGAGIAPMAGPDHVYHFRMPFKGRVSAVASPTAPYAASVYLLNSCGNAATEKACNYAGTLSHDAGANEELYLYVDSGSKNLSTANAGAYQVAVTLRAESPAGGACGNGTTDPYCGPGLFCQDEGLGGVCRAGNPESCATAVPLTFRQTAAGRVAHVFGSTVGAKDDVFPDCSASNPPADTAGVDHVYSFKVTAAATVKIALQPGAGYDAVFALVASACSNVADALCKDGGEAGDAETETYTVPAGTHYVVVDAYSAFLESSGSYDLTVTLP